MAVIPSFRALTEIGGCQPGNKLLARAHCHYNKFVRLRNLNTLPAYARVQRTFEALFALPLFVLSTPLALLGVAIRLAQGTAKTDRCLKRIHPDAAGALYKQLNTVHDIFHKNKIGYWATNDTLLGMQRHKGMIPWASNASLALRPGDTDKLLSPVVKRTFNKNGLKVVTRNHSVRICPTKRPSFNATQHTPKSHSDGTIWPYVNVFLMKENKGNIFSTAEQARKAPPKNHFSKSDVEETSLFRRKFGHVTLLAPSRGVTQEFCSRIYGKDWETAAYSSWDHENGCKVRKEKVQLVTAASAKYTTSSL
jgi:hypothetical protein